MRCERRHTVTSPLNVIIEIKGVLCLCEFGFGGTAAHASRYRSCAPRSAVRRCAPPAPGRRRRAGRAGARRGRTPESRCSHARVSSAIASTDRRAGLNARVPRSRSAASKQAHAPRAAAGSGSFLHVCPDRAASIDRGWPQAGDELELSAGLRWMRRGDHRSGAAGATVIGTTVR